MVNKPKCLPQSACCEMSESPFMATWSSLFTLPHLHPPNPCVLTAVTHSTAGQEVTSQTPLHLINGSTGHGGNPSTAPSTHLLRTTTSSIFSLLCSPHSCSSLLQQTFSFHSLKNEGNQRPVSGPSLLWLSPLVPRFQPALWP